VLQQDHAQRGYPSPSRQLFVGNLIGSVSEEALVALFSRFGEVETIKSFTNRGYAFVVYASIRVAMYVREQMNLYPPFLGGRPLVVNFGRV
jgi:RNA recognition motif-containing protein